MTTSDMWLAHFPPVDVSRSPHYSPTFNLARIEERPNFAPKRDQTQGHDA